LDDAHIFRAADRPVLLDVFCVAGAEWYRAILDDVAGVHRRIPRERMRHALEIPYIARENNSAEILALRKAGHAPPDDHGRVCQGTAADAPSRSRTNPGVAYVHCPPRQRPFPIMEGPCC
jgi:hypothetical protein